jgi:hypothetical protein
MLHSTHNVELVKSMRVGSWFVALVASWIVAACAAPSISLVLLPDTYMVSRTDKGGMLGNTSAMIPDVIREANEFAASKGKVAIPVLMREVPAAGGRFAFVEYQFRVLDKDDPAARQSSALLPRPDVVIEKTEKSSIDVKGRDQTERAREIYTELIKLDDLRKRGILTDAEFEAEKKKLLNRN